jgi:N-acetylneuraminate synthase
MEFTADQWRGLYEHAQRVGLEFVSSPFSLEAVDMLAETGIDRWKIASGEVSNLPLLKRLASDGRPVVVSSGMSTYDEIQHALDILATNYVDVTLMQCTSAYPCPPERIGLNQIQELHKRFGLPVGLSDHSGTVFPGLAAVALGASMVEVHVVFSRECFGPDVPASLTFDELAVLSRGVAFLDTALRNPVDKEMMAADMSGMRELFTRSIVTRSEVQAGEMLTEANLAFRKPGTGIPVSEFDNVVGRRTRTSLSANHILSYDDLDETAGR